MTRKRPSRTIEQLRTISDRIFYEWWMLTELAQGLASDSSVERTSKNAFIEACAIHTRVLVDFFYAYVDNRGPRQDDAIAEDFFPTRESWENLRPVRPSILDKEAFRIHVDRAIVHITYANQEKKQWQFVEIANAIQPAVEAFISKVPSELLGSRWNNLDKLSGSRWNNLKQYLATKHDHT